MGHTINQAEFHLPESKWLEPKPTQISGNGEVPLATKTAEALW